MKTVKYNHIPKEYKQLCGYLYAKFNFNYDSVQLTHKIYFAKGLTIFFTQCSREMEGEYIEKL